MLYVCFNKLLAEYAARGLVDLPSVQAIHFHELCLQWARKADVAIVGPLEDPSIDQQEFFNRVLPNLLLEAAERLEDRYDAIIADEGQDFLPEWWQVLQFTLRDPDTSDLFVFFDESQDIYRRKHKIPDLGDVYPLTRNLRNTKQIHEYAFRFYRGKGEPVALGPEGRVPEVLLYDTPEECVNQVRQLLHRLVVKERIKPSDVTVLSPRSESSSVLWKARRFGNVELTNGEPTESHHVPFRTFQRFKGLESPVVILAEIEKEGWPHPETILYVGGTRATQYLAVVAGKSVANLADPSGSTKPGV